MRPTKIPDDITIIGAKNYIPYISSDFRKAYHTNNLGVSTVITLKVVLPFVTNGINFYRPQRSCEGYVFTGVCLSTGGGAWSWGVCSRGVPGPGGMSAGGGCLVLGWCLLPGGAWSWRVCSGGCLVLGGSAPGGGCLVPGGAWWRPPRDGYCCGRYASFWNAFLSIIKSHFFAAYYGQSKPPDCSRRPCVTFAEMYGEAESKYKISIGFRMGGG